MKKQPVEKSEETIKEQNMTLMLLLSYNKMKIYNDNFSDLPVPDKQKLKYKQKALY